MQRDLVIPTAVCCAFLGVGLIVTAGPIAPPAGPVNSTMKTLVQVEPRIIVNELPGDASSMHVISTPGSYYLVENVIGVSGLDGIKIASSDVTLDLNGFSVVGAPGSGVGVIVQAATTLRLSVSNGVIRGWGDAGLWAMSSRASRFTSLRSAANGGDGVHVGLGSIVRDVHAVANGGSGIHARLASTVESCVTRSNTSHGIRTESECVVRNVHTESNGGDGILAENNVTIVGCYSAYNTGATGIDTGNGIRAGTYTVISDCHTYANTTSGVWTDHHANIRDSLSVENGDDGFSVGNGSRISGCVANINGDDGFQFEAGCLLQGNIARENAFGFYDSATLNSASVLRDNTASANLAIGFDLDGTGALIAGNTAHDNVMTDFFFTPGNHQIGEIITALGTVGAVSPFANFAPVAAPPITEGPAKPFSPKDPGAN